MEPEWSVELDWKAITGLWGAGLSTLLAVLGLMAGRPICTFSPTNAGDNRNVRLRIDNPSKRPMQISRIKSSNKLNIKCFKDGNLVTKRDAIESHITEQINFGTFEVFIPGESHAHIWLGNLDSTSRGWLVLRWHRHGWLPRLPLVVRIDGERLLQINRGLVNRDAGSKLS